MKVSKEISQIIPYSPGKPISETKRELGLSVVHKLASNECPNGPSPKAVTAMTQALSELHRYPDPNCFDLRGAMAHYLEVAPEWLAFGNGSNELIDLLVRTYCEQGEAILTSVAAFLAYPLCAQAARVRTIEVPLTEDLRFDLPALAGELQKDTANQIRIVFIANPNNPTGTYVTRQEFEKFMSVAGSKENLLVVVDEAYFEFVRAKDSFSTRTYLEKYENLLFLRTMSKVFGLAGLRLGVLVGRPEHLDYINRVRNPFNVNSIAQAGALAALGDKDHLEKVRQTTWSGLDYFYGELNRLGLKYWPSEGNFVLFDTHRDAKAVFQALLRHGVIMRPVVNYGFPSLLRLSVGLEKENRAAMDALEKVLIEIPADPVASNS
ncbi:MAG: histidinol-phosphate transaminase [Bdellovibrionaceae bacterium]|nr:histidinol-phosphate transaminase [Bdellovibrionales bacterium]MCB9085813.1 histidinol-phosphate transaminase [Pseudobdellovibrionaceae bacterium]